MTQQSSQYVDQLLDMIHTSLLGNFDTNMQRFADNAEKIDKVISLFSDSASRNLYIQQIACLMASFVSENLGECFNPMSRAKWRQIIAQAPAFFAQNKVPELQSSHEKLSGQEDFSLVENFMLDGYNYGDLVRVEKGEIFLDCGAFIGDTALWAYSHGAEQVYSFEPCKDNHVDLKANLSRYQHPVENIVPFGVSNKNSKSKFQVKGDRAASLIVTDEDPVVQDPDMDIQEIETIRLDDWCAQTKVNPTYIKMDIEGAELDALDGCQETIKRLKPKLAICLYHKLADAWEIPLYIHSLVPEYKFYCRKNHFKWEFVLFATV